MSQPLPAFTNRVARHILTNYAGNTHTLGVVFPNRRAGNFLKLELAAFSDKPMWAPKTFSAEEFMVSLSGMKMVDSLSAVLKFYEVYKAIEQAEADSFDKFITWAPTLIKDFNEIDLFCVEADQLLSYIHDVKKLESWNPSGDEPSEVQKAFLKFWGKMPGWYKAFTTKLKENNEGYQGLVFRQVAENPLKALQSISSEKIILAGFNALNTCEQRFFNFLVESGKAEIIWDADMYYSQDEVQEAGLYFRKLNQTALVTKAVKPVLGDYLSRSEKKITISAVPMQTAQARTMNIFLEELSLNGKLGVETAVVMGDESLLYPVLSSIPNNAGQFNVTLGLPFKSTKAYSFLMLLLDIFQTKKERSRLTAKQIISFLQHPYSVILLGENSIAELLYHIKEVKPVMYHKPSELVEAVNEKRRNLIAWLGEKQNTAVEVLSVLKIIFESIAQKALPVLEDNESIDELELTNYNLLSQEVHFTRLLLEKVEEACAYFPKEALALKTLEKIIGMLLGKETIPLVGEPLKGLQVMGMLETRNLDFKNVILMGFNEGKIPTAENAATFITHDTRYQFGLPMQHDRDAIFAYHFYRLMQRAENLWFIYDTDEQSGGEPSRFLLQVEKELAVINPNIKITYRNPFHLPAAPQENAINIVKTEKHLAQIKSKANIGFSPTLLNSLRKCSLQFYLKYIANIDAAWEEDDMLGADVFGNIIHKMMEELFLPLIGIKLNSAMLLSLLPKVNAEAERQFEDATHILSAEAGRYTLDLEIVKFYVSEYLKLAAKELESPANSFTIDSLERVISAELPISNEISVNLKGTADRIERTIRGYRIVDFKTGRIDDKELRLRNWDELLTNKDKDKAFQLLTYSWLLSKQDGIPIQDITPAFISMRSLSKGHRLLQLTIGPDKPPTENTLDQHSINEFEAVLKGIIAELFNTATPFTQTDNKEICRTCGFKDFCGR